MPFGALTHIGLGKEATWGTPVASTEYLQFVSEGINEEIEQIISAAQRGIVDESASFEGLHNIAGDISFEVYPNVLGHMLRAAFGEPVTTQPDATGSPTVYQHVFTPVQDNFSSLCALPPYTLEVHRDLEQAFQYTGAVVNDLTLSFGTDQKIMQGSAAVIAKTLQLIAKTAPSFEVTNPFLWHQAKISINGAENKDVQTLQFGVNNSLEGRTTLSGTREISRIRRTGRRTFPVNFTFDLSDLSEFNRFRAQQEVATRIELTGDVISGTFTYKLIIDIPKLRYTAFPINIGGSEQITAQATGVAKYDPASNFAMKVTLVNTKQSY
ncbi:phage tail tube protein [Tepidibacillus decaturensis]|uniref:Phage tail protein n=1 Tax=Tepidibacillus decaturensis TaxID=1413211 RepID=A0A135L1P6_9BACI|nr:phage tail tube protein [Tepidibacillus decaturensis]KXG42876.1 hypothetical protein U473_01650 [Tepidibacillus decaturensis]